MATDDRLRREVVLVTHADPAGPPDPIRTLKEVFSSSMGMASYAAATMASLIEQTVTYAVTNAVNGALDRLVPAIADVVIERIDLTDDVIQQVDAERDMTEPTAGEPSEPVPDLRLKFRRTQDTPAMLSLFFN